MIFVFSLVPIVIAIFLIVAGLVGELQSNIDIINTILMVCVTLVFSGIAIYNLTRNYVSPAKKVWSTLACGVLGTVSGFVLNYFIKELAAIEFGIIGVLEFVFVGFVGGGIVLMILLGCIMACCKFGE